MKKLVNVLLGLVTMLLASGAVWQATDRITL